MFTKLRRKTYSPQELANIVGPIAARHNVTSIALFGSRATGKATSKSDYDFLIDVNESYSFHDYCKLADELEEALGTSVDIVERSVLSDDLFSRRVLREAVHVWNRFGKSVFHSSPYVGILRSHSILYAPFRRERRLPQGLGL